MEKVIQEILLARIISLANDMTIERIQISRTDSNWFFPICVLNMKFFKYLASFLQEFETKKFFRQKTKIISSHPDQILCFKFNFTKCKTKTIIFSYFSHIFSSKLFAEK